MTGSFGCCKLISVIPNGADEPFYFRSMCFSSRNIFKEARKSLRKNRKNNMLSIENRTNTIHTSCIRFENIIISNIDIKIALIVECGLL